MNDDLKQLLRDKAGDMRLGPRIPEPVLRRSRRRRMLNTALAGSLVAVLGVGAFVGARAAMSGSEATPGGIAHQPSVAPTPTVTPTPSPSPAGPPAAIIVSEPSPGDTVTSPVNISGTADVFEAVVSIQIVAQDGTVLADTTTMASCGSGCRGDYSKAVSYSVTTEQPGKVLVFERSAKDGSPIHQVTIPVTLQPSSGSLGGQNGDVWVPTSSGDAADPQKTAVAFARDVMGWAPNDVRVGPIGNGDQIAADIWNTSLTSTFTHETATTLVMHTLPSGGSWSVMHAETGVLDVTCPSNMQDGLVITDRNGRPTMEICGTLAQSNSGWTIQATVEYAASNLQPSEAESTGEIPVQGTDVHGWLPLISTYGSPSGNLVSVEVQVLDQNRNVVGEFARTLVTTG